MIDSSFPETQPGKVNEELKEDHKELFYDFQQNTKVINLICTPGHRGMYMPGFLVDFEQSEEENLKSGLAIFQIFRGRYLGDRRISSAFFLKLSLHFIHFLNTWLRMAHLDNVIL